MTAIAERRDDLAALVGNTNTTAGGDRLRERRAGARARPAADHAAARQHDVREPARDARRPRRAGRRVQARDQGPRAVPARAAPARARRAARRSATCAALIRTPGPDNDLVDATRKLPRAAAASPSPAFTSRPPGAAEGRSRCSSSRGPYTPDLVGWFRDFGQGAANYDANGHYARIQPIFNAFQFTDNPAGRRAARRSRRRSASTACRRARCSAARAPPASRPPDGSAPFTRRRHRRLRPGQVPPGP